MNKDVDIRAEKLHFAYSGAEIIQGLDLTVEHGAFHAILGPNGSGKTTLVRLISGVIEPTSGQLEIYGKHIKSYSPRSLAKCVAVVPQGAHVSLPFTALEVVLMGRYPHVGGMSLEGKEDLEMAREAMEMTGVWSLKNRTMDRLSGGEAQRVIVARALAQQPRILILDEPTVFLDIKYQVELMELLGDLHRTKGLTILAVTHDLNLAARYARWISLMRDGSIRAEGTPDKVLNAESIMDVFGVRVEVFNINNRPGILPAPISALSRNR